MDLRIAAMAIAQRATLVTANVRDFVMIDGLKIQDWTKSSSSNYDLPGDQGVPPVRNKET